MCMHNPNCSCGSIGQLFAAGQSCPPPKPRVIQIEVAGEGLIALRSDGTIWTKPTIYSYYWTKLAGPEEHLQGTEIQRCPCKKKAE